MHEANVQRAVKRARLKLAILATAKLATKAGVMCPRWRRGRPRAFRIRAPPRILHSAGRPIPGRVPPVTSAGKDGGERPQFLEINPPVGILSWPRFKGAKHLAARATIRCCGLPSLNHSGNSC